MSSNVGVGIGAFLNGLAGGAKVYSDIQNAKQTREINTMKLQDMKDEYADKQDYRSILKDSNTTATAARDADINSKIQTSTQEGPPSYQVDGQQFTDPQLAKAEAEKQVGGFTDYWAKTAAPKLTEHWMKTGQVDKAQNFNKWLEDEDVKKGVKSWASMARAYTLGDKPGFLSGLNETLSHDKYYQGAVKPISAEENRDSNGRITGYKVKFKNQGTGEETSKDFDGDDIQKLMVTAASPGQVYEQQVNEMNAAKTLRAKAAETADTRNYEQGRDATKQGYQLEQDNNKAKLDVAAEREKVRLGTGSGPLAKVRAVESYLRTKGYDDKYIADHAPSMVGIQNQNKPTATRIEDYIKMQSENSREFSKKSADQQVKEAKDYIATVDKASGQDDEGRSIISPDASTSSNRNRAEQPVVNPSQSKGLPFYDNATGRVVYR